MEPMDDSAVLAELLPILRATFAPTLPALPQPLEVCTPPSPSPLRLSLTLAPTPNPNRDST